MIRQIAIAAALAFVTACGGGEGGVMDEIRAAEEADQAELRERVDALSDAVTEDATTLPSGLELQFLRRSKDQSLPRPTLSAAVLVHYEGRLVDNDEVFDSSFARGEPANFPLGGVVPGFAEAITHMRPGDEVIATFPGELGYGERGSGPIPANAALKFRIVLLAFQEPGGRIVSAPE